MPTVVKTFHFAADAEGLVDGGDVGAIAFGAVAGDGDPAGCVRFLTTGAVAGLTESARRAATGETWETWGVPAGATVTHVQLTAWRRKIAAVTNLTSHSLLMRIVGSTGAAVTSDVLSSIFNSGALPTVTDAAWTAGGSGSTIAVNADRQASTTDVRLLFLYSVTSTAGASVDLRMDEIDVTITYTGGGVTLPGHRQHRRATLLQRRRRVRRVR